MPCLKARLGPTLTPVRQSTVARLVRLCSFAQLSRRRFTRTQRTVTSNSRVASPLARWSLARQLPLLTSAIVVIVMALTLTLTYRALRQSRSDAIHARLTGLMRAIVQAGELSTRARTQVFHQVARDTAIQRALLAERPTSD